MCDGVVVSCRTQVTVMCGVEFLPPVCQTWMENRIVVGEGAVTQLPQTCCPQSTAETGAKQVCSQWLLLILRCLKTAFSFQRLLSMLGQIKMGHFPELVDDLIKPVKIYLYIMSIHPSSGQKAQSALSRPREIQPTDITSVLLLNSLLKVIKTFNDKRKICN